MPSIPRPMREYLRSDFEWAREYLDIGKGEEIIRHARMKYQKHALPGVIRPDILVTDDGLTITELDSVPGGIGHLDCLSAAYEEAGFDLVGSPRGMRDGFASMVRSAAGFPHPVCAIVVSDESIDYLPEMLYLAGELRKTGLAAYTVRPREVGFTEEGLFIEADGARTRIDALYRFFELFDLLNIPKAELFSYAARKKLVVVTPPYKPFLEEKMLLAMLASGALEDFWVGSMGAKRYELLKNCALPTFILDNRNVPPHARDFGFQMARRADSRLARNMPGHAEGQASGHQAFGFLAACLGSAGREGGPRSRRGPVVRGGRGSPCRIQQNALRAPAL